MECDRASPLLTVFYTGDPDDITEFATEDDGVHFGRDPSACELVIWEELSGNSLSGVAGRIWRQWGQLWIANLSRSHDLFLQVPGFPPEEPLSLHAPGLPLNARTIPGSRCLVRGRSGAWALVVDQVVDPDDVAAALGPGVAWGAEVTAGASVTERAPAVPVDLRDLATALCEPLLHGARLPASYPQIARRLGTSVKVARLRVDRLVAQYENDNPILRRRREDRERRREQELTGPTWAVGPGGVRRARLGDDDGAPEGSARVWAPSLPHSYEVAHLLVRRRLVTLEDVERLAG